MLNPKTVRVSSSSSYGKGAMKVVEGPAGSGGLQVSRYATAQLSNGVKEVARGCFEANTTG